MNSIFSVIRNISSKNHSNYWRIQKYCVSLSQNSERMSSYKNKSSIYSLAAEKMHNQNLYPTVPPLAYYSCFLLMQHICYIEKQHTESTLRALPESGMLHGIHEVMTNYFRLLFRQQGKKEEYYTFFDKISQLKRLRVQADYKNEDITCAESRKAIELEHELIHILNKL